MKSTFKKSILNPINIERVTRGYQRFSEDTNITGFKELYYAKSLVFKVLWFTLILFGICFTAYQCAYTVLNYIEEPTNTVVQQLQGEPQYPSLKICYAHWIFWLDWEKFKNLNLHLDLDRDSFLYGMSFAKTVFMDQPLNNFTVAKVTFENMMSSRMYKNLSEYYLSISRDLPLGVAPVEIKLARQFHDYFGSEFCYIWPDNYLNESQQLTSKLNIDLKYDINIDYLSQLELNYYRRAAFAYESSNSTHMALLGNESEIFISPMIYADGTTDQVIPDANYFQYILRLKANVYKWKNTADRPCSDDYGVDFCGKLLRNCLKRCQVISKQGNITNSCIPFRNVEYYDNYAGRVCQQDFVLTLPKSSNTTTFIQGDTVAEEDGVGQGYQVCADQCPRPCQQWIYETSTVTNLRPYQFRNNLPSTTDVEIQYPQANTIVVMQEVPSQTWQKMLSDVGGLLGLWMGATIFSFFQIIFLCCCGEIDASLAQRKLNKIATDRSETGKRKNNNEPHVEINQLHIIHAH